MIKKSPSGFFRRAFLLLTFLDVRADQLLDVCLFASHAVQLVEDILVRPAVELELNLPRMRLIILNLTLIYHHYLRPAPMPWKNRYP